MVDHGVCEPRLISQFIFFSGIAVTKVGLSGIVGAVYFYTREHPVRDEHTRRRKCEYILKGITEPRCSECGERI